MSPESQVDARPAYTLTIVVLDPGLQNITDNEYPLGH